MRADNSHHLKAAAKDRADQARRRAIETLIALEAAGHRPTIAGLAKAAQVARSWIYTQPDLLERIRATAGTTPTPPTRTSDESWHRRLDLAHQRIRELTEENQQLRTQLAVTLGRLRADRTATTRTPSTTQEP